MNVTGDPSGPPQRAKVFTGDYITALTGWAATMMALWEVKKTGRGQVIDLAQYEAVAQTQGNTACRSTPGRASLRPHRQSGARISALRHLQVQRRLGVHRRAGRRDLCAGAEIPRARSGRVQLRGLLKRRGRGEFRKGTRTRPPASRILRRAHRARGRDRAERRADRLRARVQHAGSVCRTRTTTRGK